MTDRKALLNVHELFFSLQGEGTHTGEPCAFVRLARCNLRCRWCDTTEAFTKGTDMTVDEAVAWVTKQPTKTASVTGGEPLLQPSAFDLITALADRGYTVLVETSGSIAIAPVDPRAVVVLDLKCPGSGCTEHMVWDNIEALRPHHEVKFVIADERDFRWAAEQVARYELARRATVLFGPVWGELAPETLATWILKEGLPVRLNIQLHKYLWGPETEGV
ncbi:MAG: radical SAM protein [Candidatus Tectimicrobiota bacterium]